MYLDQMITLADTCIQHVSSMYPACIPHGSCMDPAWILHLRYVSLKIHLRYMYLIMCLGCIPHVS